MLENEKQLYCKKNNHNQPITIVITEQNYKIEDRFLCDICWKGIQIGLHTIPFSSLMDNIKEQQNSFSQNLNMIILKNVVLIEKIKEQIDTIKTSMISTLKDCEEKIKIWHESLIELEQQNSIYSIYSEVERYFQNESKLDSLLELTGQINELNYDFSKKIQLQLTSLKCLSKYESCQQSLLELQWMDLEKMVENGSIIQNNSKNFVKPICEIHNQEIIFVDSSKDVNIESRTSCFKCNRRNGDTVQEFIQKWQSYNQECKGQFQNEFQNFKKHVEDENKKLKIIRKDINKAIDEKLHQNNEQLKINYDTQCKSIQELNYLLNHQKFNQIAEKLSVSERKVQCNQNYKDNNCLLISQINQILNKFDQNEENHQNIKSITFEKIQNIPKKSKNYIEQESVNQQCFAVAFNREDNIMISGFGSEIKVWLFSDGQLTEIDKFEGHDDNISCLLFSQYSNSFVSGSMDFTIKLWKEKSLLIWECSQSFQEHTDFISCIILSKDENFLFSGSYDKTIRIWRLDFPSKTLSQAQALEYHTNLVLGLSLNPSEQLLVSCGQDLQINLWHKGKNNLWNFKQKIKQSIQDFGYRIQFLNDSQFVWINKGYNGSISVFELENDLFIEKLSKQINLSEEDNEDKDFFPIMHNTKLQVFFVKHKKSIYSFKQEINSNITQISNVQISDNPEFYGVFTNNGKYVVINSRVPNQNHTQVVIYKLHFH
ncbi:unnamed protein product [Paramecium sonneborni]|uniref:WD40-repeat-containing domain n=1 Tax=Paramecium sonneborni TaxID=65129 RepID=A0A8S1RI97_9CILI|nr:unnamed protein product [Paramecium sonneborni]